jgi:hypothetical protein
LYKKKHYDTLSVPTKKYLEHYDDLQKRIPREEVERHRDTIIDLIGNSYKIDIVGSFRRGELFCGDIDVLFTTTTTSSHSSSETETNHVEIITQILTTNGYLIETLKCGTKVMNGIARLKSTEVVRRVDLFFSPQELYAFALLLKTGDIHFNKSLRTCIKEKNPDYSLSERGIRFPDRRKMVGNWRTEDSILDFIGIGRRLPHEMVGNIPAGSCTSSKSSSKSSTRKRSKDSTQSFSPDPSIKNRTKSVSRTQSFSPDQSIKSRTKSVSRTQSFSPDPPSLNSRTKSESQSPLTGNDLSQNGEHYSPPFRTINTSYESDDTRLSSLLSHLTRRSSDSDTTRLSPPRVEF